MVFMIDRRRPPHTRKYTSRKLNTHLLRDAIQRKSRLCGHNQVAAQLGHFHVHYMQWRRRQRRQRLRSVFYCHQRGAQKHTHRCLAQHTHFNWLLADAVAHSVWLISQLICNKRSAVAYLACVIICVRQNKVFARVFSYSSVTAASLCIQNTPYVCYVPKRTHTQSLSVIDIRLNCAPKVPETY